MRLVETAETLAPRHVRFLVDWKSKRAHVLHELADGAWLAVDQMIELAGGSAVERTRHDVAAHEIDRHEVDAGVDRRRRAELQTPAHEAVKEIVGVAGAGARIAGDVGRPEHRDGNAARTGRRHELLGHPLRLIVADGEVWPLTWTRRRRRCRRYQVHGFGGTRHREA